MEDSIVIIVFFFAILSFVAFIYKMHKQDQAEKQKKQFSDFFAKNIMGNMRLEFIPPLRETLNDASASTHVQYGPLLMELGVKRKKYGEKIFYIAVVGGLSLLVSFLLFQPQWYSVFTMTVILWGMLMIVSLLMFALYGIESDRNIKFYRRHIVTQNASGLKVYTYNEILGLNIYVKAPSLGKLRGFGFLILPVWVCELAMANDTIVIAGNSLYKAEKMILFWLNHLKWQN